MKPIEINLTRTAERIQFSKELYDANPSGYTVEDRLGRPVKVLCTDLKGDEPIAAVDYSGDLGQYGKNGLFRGLGRECNLDLFLRPVAGKGRDMWINVYYNTSYYYATEAEANSNALDTRTALIHIVQ